MGQNKTKTIVTVGNGVASWCLHFYLKNTGLNIINVASDDFFKPCSHSSTAINCLRGTTPGNSPLGDEIIASMEEFEDFYNKHKMDGVSLGHEYQILETKTIEKWERRYPEFFEIKDHEFLSSVIDSKNLYHKVPAYFIDIPNFEKWLKDNSGDVEYKNDLVLKIERIQNAYEVHTRSGVINADAIVLCTSHLSNLLTSNTTSDFKYYFDHSKKVTGGYLELKNAKSRGFTFEASFVLAIEKYHFIYRKDEDIIQIGSSSKNKDALELPLVSELRSIYGHVNHYTKFDIPDFTKFEMTTGIRHKGYLRRPFWGSTDGEKLFAICGLYKNAFSFAFKAAKDISKAI